MMNVLWIIKIMYNKNQLSWVVDNNRFQNSNKCMVDLGVTSGNTNFK